MRDPIQGPPQETAQAQDQGEWKRDPIQGPPPPEQTQQTKPGGEPEGEGALATGVRHAAEAVIPGLAGAAGWIPGAAAGATIGSAIPGIGTAVGGVVGGLITSFVAGGGAALAQDWLKKKLGFDDSETLAQGAKEHPIASGVGTVGGLMASFTPGGAGALAARVLRGGMVAGDAGQLVARGANAAIGGAIDLAQTGDPVHAAAVGATSTLLGGPTAAGKAVMGASEQLTAKLGLGGAPGEKLTSTLARSMSESPKSAEAEANPATGATVDGAATEIPKPDPAAEKAAVQTSGLSTPGGRGQAAAPPLKDGIATGETQNTPTRDGGNKGIYAKDAIPGEEGGGTTPAPLGTLNPDIEAVLRPKAEPPPEAPARPAEAAPAERPVQQAQQEQPTAPQPERTPENIRQRIRQIEYDRRLSRVGDEPYPPHGELSALRQELKNLEGPRQQAQQEQGGEPAPRAAAVDRTMDLIKSLKDESAARAAAKENPPSEFDAAATRAVEAAQKSPYKNTGKQARQQDEPVTRGPPREPPGGPPAEPPEPGPKDARLNKPPLLESKGGGMFNSLRRTFAPEFMSPASEKAGEALRRGQGVMEGLNKEWTHKLEKHFPAMEKLIKNGDMQAFTDKIEGGNHFPEYTIPKELEGAASDIKGMFKAYKEKAAEISKDPEAVRAWNDNFVTHIYKDEPKSFWDRVGGGGVRGSGGSLKARKYETYAQAKEDAGHEPRHPNILNTAEAYRTELGKHIATEMAKQEMRAGGHLKYAMPEPNVGASGQLSSLKEGNRIHEGWEPVENMSMGGRQAYMPRDAANVFNNHLSPGLKGNKYIAPFYEAWREASNRFTGMELGLFNGFHFFVTGGESVLSNQSRGVSELGKSAKYAVQGNLKDAGIELSAAGKSLLTAPAAPIANYHAGRRFMAIAEGNDKPWSVFSPLKRFKQPTETEKLMVKASQDAGIMPHGRSYAPDENLSKMGTYFQSYMRGQFGREMSELVQRVKDNPFKGVPVETWNAIGRGMQSMSEPLFGHYIPALKYGTMMKDLESFMRQSKVDLRTPQGMDKATAFLRKQGNAMDVRIGEANAQNMFMNKSIQQAGYGLLRSFSWARGTGIAILGGPGGVAKTLAEGVKNKDMGAAMQKLANKLDMTHKDYDPNLTYSIAFPFGTAMIGTAYQLIKTSLAGDPKFPSSFKDLYLPRTGGMIPGAGGKGDVEERVPLPGYHKEIRGAIHDPVAEVMNKRNALITTLGEQATGMDWKNQPIVRPDATLGENLTDRAKHIQNKLLNPLMLKNVTATPPEGSNISTTERVLGLKQAGKAYLDPEKSDQGAAARYKKAWDSSKNTEWKEQHGGRENIPKAELRKTYGSAGAPPEELTRPSTLRRTPAPAAGGWVRDPIQGPAP